MMSTLLLAIIPVVSAQDGYCYTKSDCVYPNVCSVQIDGVVPGYCVLPEPPEPEPTPPPPPVVEPEPVYVPTPEPEPLPEPIEEEPTLPPGTTVSDPLPVAEEIIEEFFADDDGSFDSDLDDDEVADEDEDDEHSPIDDFEDGELVQEEEGIIDSVVGFFRNIGCWFFSCES